MDQEELNYRKVKFRCDTKEDKSHLAPKREKGGSWRSFVTSPDDASTDDNDEGALVLRDGVDDDMNQMGGKRRRRYRRFGPPMKSLRRKISSLFRCTSVYWPKASFFLLLFIALVVGLSVGLKKDKNAGEDDNDHNAFDKKRHNEDGNNDDGSMHESIMKNNMNSDSSPTMAATIPNLLRGCNITAIVTCLYTA